MSFLAQLEFLYHRMKEAGVSKLEFQIGAQEKLRLIRKSEKPSSVIGDSKFLAQGSESVSQTLDVGYKVTAPLSGVFYRALSPSSPALVEEGSGVNRGHVLCIFEAMKVMNEIRAEQEGTVSKILIENGKPVEAHQTLFLLAPVK